jgi:lactate 2-monooxygenase
MDQQQPQSPIAYEQSIYTKGLHYIRPQISLKSTEWQSQAEARMSAESKGYLIGNAGTGETTDKNLREFRQWSIVPRRLVKVDGLPDLATKVLGKQLQYSMALAPVGVQRKLIIVH